MDAVVERLRRGGSVALVAERDAAARRRLLGSIQRQMRALGRAVIWIDLEGAVSGAELGARIVQGCMPEMDMDELADLLERLPAKGRLDLEAFAELLMLPETVASGRGKRVVAILDGFESVERAIGFSGLGVVRDALLARERVAYLFVGSARLSGLFGRPQMPLYGLAEVIETAGAQRSRASAPPVDEPPVAAADADPLAAALLGWAEAPSQPKPDERLVIAREMPSAEVVWQRLMARERRDRDTWDVDDDDPFRRRRRRRR